MSDPHNVLTTSEKNLCEYGAALGVVLSVVCLVQHSVLVIPGPVTNPMIPAYFFFIITFILLGLQKSFSVVLLIIGAGLSAVIEWLWTTHYSFSLVVLMLFFYHVVAIVVLFMQDIPKKLKLKKAAEKADKEIWADKI